MLNYGELPLSYLIRAKWRPMRAQIPTVCQLAAVWLICAAADVAGCCTVAQSTSNWRFEDGNVRTTGLLEASSQNGITQKKPSIHSGCFFDPYFNPTEKTLLPVIQRTVKSLLIGFYWSASLRIRCAGISLTYLGWWVLLIFHRAEARRCDCGFKFQSLDLLFPGFSVVAWRCTHLV